MTLSHEGVTCVKGIVRYEYDGLLNYYPCQNPLLAMLFCRSRLFGELKLKLLSLASLCASAHPNFLGQGGTVRWGATWADSDPSSPANERKFLSSPAKEDDF